MEGILVPVSTFPNLIFASLVQLLLLLWPEYRVMHLLFRVETLAVGNPNP